MQYTKIIKGDVLALTFEGDLLGENKGAELVALATETINSGVVFCLINLCKVRYINSNGIGVLITLLTKYRNRNGELYLVNPSDQVMKLLSITKLREIFTVVLSEEEVFKKIN